MRERLGCPDWMVEGAEDLIARQYADRPQLRPIFDRVVSSAEGCGPVVVQARKTHVSLMTARRKLATVQATTRKRIDLGLRLDDESPSGRLERAGGRSDDVINLRVALREPDEVEGEVAVWLRRAYEANS